MLLHYFLFRTGATLVLALESWHKGSDCFYRESIGGWRTDEARPLVRLLLYVAFSALMLMAASHKDIWLVKNPLFTIFRGSFKE